MTTKEKYVIGIIIIIWIVGIIAFKINSNKTEEPQENIVTTNNTTVNNTIDSMFNQYAPNSYGDANEKKAIALVKEEWGADDSKVKFNISNVEGDIYYVSVSNMETLKVVSWYKVNVKTEEVRVY